MHELSTITAFFGWCTLLNLLLYLISAISVVLFKAPLKRLHSKISGIAPEKLDVIYFTFLGNYKRAIFITNLVPYIALKLMGA